MHVEQIPEPWASFLSQVDDCLGEEVELHCFGGFVVTIRYGLTRSTACSQQPTRPQCST